MSLNANLLNTKFSNNQIALVQWTHTDISLCLFGSLGANSGTGKTRIPDPKNNKTQTKLLLN